MDSLRLKFTSGNNVPVGEAKITRKEFLSLEKEMAELKAERNMYKAQVILSEAGWGDNDVEWANQILRERA